MSTKNGKNPHQRFHLVLAETRSKAEPILDRLLSNGLQRNKVQYVLAETGLQRRKGEECAFIFGPDYMKHPRWSFINNRMTELIHDGAIIKADPEKAARKSAEEEKARQEKEAAERAAKGRLTREQERLAIEKFFKRAPIGGLWDQIGPGKAELYTPRMASMEPYVVVRSESSRGYKEYYLGGPQHGKRRKAFPAPGPDMVENVPVPLKRNPTIQPGAFGVTLATYRSYAAEILGQPVMFWVHEPSWNDRQRLARELVLMPLEV